MRPLSLSLSVAVLALGSSAALAQAPGGPGGRGFQSPVIAALDTDGDGELSAKEIENATVALKKLDKNSDGKLTTEELRPAGALGGRGGAFGGATPAERVTRIMAFDKDSDGKISKAELPENLQVMMDRADTNKDGFLDKAEVTAMAERQGVRGAGGRGGRGGQPQPN